MELIWQISCPKTAKGTFSTFWTSLSKIYLKFLNQKKNRLQLTIQVSKGQYQKSRKLIFGSCCFLPPLPLELCPLPLPLPLPLPPVRLKNDFPCFISIIECSNSSQSMHPVYKVAPSSKGVVFLLKSTSNIVDSHSAQCSWVVVIRWAPSGRKTRQLHMLQ